MKYIFLQTFLVLTACSSTTGTNTFRGPQIPEVQKPSPIITRNVNVEVIDKERMIELLRDPNFRRIVGISEQDYENLLFNINDSIRYIQIQNAIIEYYQTTLRDINAR